MSVSPRAADAIRKVVGYTLAAAITVLLFRVLGRAADGRQRLADVELIALVVLMALALLWVRAAKQIRRGGADPTAGEGPTDAGSTTGQRPEGPDAQ